VDAGETYSATSTEEKIATKKEGQELFSERNASDEKQFNPEGKTLDEQLEDILHTADSFDGRYLYIGRFTSDFIDMMKPYVDIKELPIAMNYRDAYLSMESKDNGKYKGDGINYHDLGKEGLKSAIESFGSPEQVLLSKKDGKIELVLEGVDKKGNKLLSIVALNTVTKNSKKYIEAHIVTSIYGKRSIERYINKAEQEGRLIYNKKEGLTQVNPQVQYEGIVNANSSKDSISQSPNSVNRKFSERDSSYMDAVTSGDMETAQKMVDEVARKAGYTIKAYHGTSRGDRVGNVFLPERATSGPMAFFTDNKDIADNYARNKADTSLTYDTEYDSYYTQFRVNRKGKNISIPELWNYLSFAERNRIKEKAKHVKFDDDYESIIVDSTAEHGNGAWDAYTLNMHKGNALEALVDTWLETGDLFNREADFIKVLEFVGISDVEYRNPDARYEKTYDTWLKIKKPFDTENVNQSFYNSLSEWIDNHDMSVYEKESSNADLWDKNNQSPESWLDKLSHDIENETTHAWTVIPDFVTDYLKQQGYDGIKDKGGKGGGVGHTVYIPFSSEQIKSAESVTYDDDGKVIPLSERFKPENNDIRYSDRDYSYEGLINKPDMKVTEVDDSVKHNRADIVVYALKNAASVGLTNQNGNAVVHVDDIDTDVIVPKRSLVHGLDRRMNTQAPVLMKIGEILKNSIRINELNPRSDDIKSSYVLVGVAQNQDGHLYIASFVVNKYSNEVTEIDVLYSANAKKESAALLPKITDKSATPTDSVISIAQLLDYVNRYFPDILSESVLRHYGYDSRPEGKIGESALYSDRDYDSVSNRSLLANALESVAQNDIERNKLKEYKGKIALIESEQAKLTEIRAKIKELSFAKGPRDTEQIKSLQFEANQAANRINTYDRQLLNLESTTALKGVLEREKQMAYKKAERQGKEALAAQ